MSKIAVIGAGISGLSVARLLQHGHDVTVFEQNNYSGGLVHCTEADGVLFHRVGGHIFNSRIPEVLDWFWSVFNKTDFVSSNRFSKIWFKNNSFVDYPIENYIYQLEEAVGKKIIHELLHHFSEKGMVVDNFEDFLKQRFGDTLYELYFNPYNTKIWKYDLSELPLGWLEGKLPMPDLESILNANLFRTAEQQMVHSSFYYPRKGGSQFIADTLSADLSIRYGYKIESFTFENDKWSIEGEAFDRIVFTGDVRTLDKSLSDALLAPAIKQQLPLLKSNPTTNILCELDPVSLSWLYLPDPEIKPHRIIYTGNFSPNNNGKVARITGTIEYSGFISQRDFEKEIELLPGHPKVISYNYCPMSYVFHLKNSKQIIEDVKNELSTKRFHLLGRFAEWEYYNMDTAIYAAMKLAKSFE